MRCRKEDSLRAPENTFPPIKVWFQLLFAELKCQTQRESAENRNPYNINAYLYVLGQLGDLIEQ